MKGGPSFGSRPRYAAAGGQFARKQKRPTSPIDRKTSIVLLVVAFVLTFTLSFALFHYKDTIASTFAAEEAPTLLNFDSEISAATPVPEVSSPPRFAVQVAAYDDHAQAEALARRLSSRHELVTVSPARINGKMHYRVRIPAQTGADADRLAATLRRELGIEAWVVYLP